MERGKIRNRAQAQQIRDFRGLKWGTITPTDIDAFFEIDNKLFVLIELKYKKAKLPYGQKLAIERIIDALQKTVEAIAIICWHEIPPSSDINAAECYVTEYRYRKRWIIPKLEMSLKDCCDKFIGLIMSR